MNKPKVKRVFSWVLQVLLSLEFILAGQAKFTNPEAWQKQFDRWSYPDGTYYIVGGLEVILAILLLFPKYAYKAALGMAVIMLGASITHIIHGESRTTVTMILMVLLITLSYLRKPELK
ncbi:DoxX family protein [Roseivirga sp. E12]|uniref:DoxX family protein n=1 Tax=Roseivirga sp. E12 TaxID=2819237 RepID=UPI001ABC65C2|nr:DoxX family protein [Roseivirga sp. E12]MBO3697209.1 DoxX family protein [Roseivirga sp. E12]